MKRFDLEDQRRFADLSGDYNPLHLDPVYCRRLLFGEPIVHGVHVLLWCLEQLCQRVESPIVLKELKATFGNPLLLDAALTIETLEITADGFKIRTVGDHCRVAGQLDEEADADAWSIALPGESPREDCVELDFGEAARAAGAVPLFLDQAEFRAMFPALAQRLPAVQAAQVLATSRLTGMKCPGARSVFHALDLHFGADSEEPLVHYEVCRSDERFSVLHLAVRSVGMEGELTTFLRPTPVGQPLLTEVARHVRAGEFSGQRALIVGGSRGLGELTAKIIATGGGAARITYCVGKPEAEQLAGEMAEQGTDCKCFPLDVTEEVTEPLRAGLRDFGPTHLYYFATPHMGRSESQAPFSVPRFERFSRYYVESFSAVMEAMAAAGGPLAAVLYPSSAYVDTLADGMGEFGAAKAAGEALCRLYQRRWRSTRFHVPRLPRLQTDQTASIRPMPTENSLEVMLTEIRALEAM